MLYYTEGNVLKSYNTVTDQKSDLGSTGLANLGLSFAPDGTLYGYQNDFGLFTIDTNDASTAFVGGSPVLNRTFESLAFGLDGNLYTGDLGGLGTIDLNNGAFTSLGLLSNNFDIDGLTVAPMSVGSFAAGTLFAIDSGSLWAIDINALTSTFVANTRAAGLESLTFDALGNLYLFGTSAISLFDFATATTSFVTDIDRISLGAAARIQVSEVSSPSTIGLMGISILLLVPMGRKWAEKINA